MMKMTHPISVALAAILVGGVVLVAAVTGGSAKKSQPTITAGSAVSVKQTSLGKTLVDADGRTLYLFQADKQGVSNLSRAGLAVWPPLTATGTPLASGGASAAAIGTIAGPGTTRQVTYNGHPLYHYVGDKNAGDTHGQRLNQFGALWFVLSPSGNAVTSSPSTAAMQSPQPSRGYGYGY